MRRPFLYISLFYMLGIVLGYMININILLLIKILLFSIIVFLLLYFNSKYNYSCFFISVIIILTGMTSYTVRINQVQPVEINQNSTSIVLGNIIEQPIYQQDKTTIIIQPEYVQINNNSYTLNGNILLNIYHKKHNEINYTLLEYGDKISIRGKLYYPNEMRNPSCFNYRTYLKQKNIYYLMSSDWYRIKKLGKYDYNKIKHIILSYKNKINKLIDSCLDISQSSILKGILFGDKSSITQQTRQNFTDIGIAHILAVSGLHVSFIAAALIFIYKIFNINKWISFFLTSFILSIYCLMCGISTSVIRASIMFCLLLLGKVINKNSDSLNNVLVAAFIILVINPLMLFNIGFQFSFITTIAIITIYPIFKNKLQVPIIPEKISDLVFITLSAQLGIMPLLMFYYNQLSLVSLISNLFLTPLIGIVVILGFIAILTNFIIPYLSFFIFKILNLLLALIQQFADMLAKIPLSKIIVPSPSLIVIILYYLMLMIILYVASIKNIHPKTYKKTVCIILIMLLVMPSTLFINDGMLKVVFLDVGQGDCIHISKSGYNILIDTGGNSYNQNFNVGEDIVLPYLLKNGVKYIDAVFISHLHDDHVGGLIDIIQNLKVNNIIIGAHNLNNQIFEQISIAAKRKKIPITKIKSGNIIEIGELLFYVLHPQQQKLANTYSDINNNSVVLKMKYKNISFLFTGDIENEAEKQLIDIYSDKLNSDILKVAHHGSNTSSTNEFIKLVTPDIAIIQVGKNNFGQPNMEVLTRLEKLNIKTYRTDKNGAIIIKSDGIKYNVSTVLN